MAPLAFLHTLKSYYSSKPDGRSKGFPSLAVMLSPL